LRQLAEITPTVPGVKVQWLAVYIAEAHADDEWPVASARYNAGQEVHVNQTRSIKERAVQAQAFFDNFSYTEDNRIFSKWRLLVAPPEEDLEASKLSSYVFEDIYKPWPFRAYGFLNKDIDLLPEPHACELRIQEITNWLENNLFSN